MSELHTEASYAPPASYTRGTEVLPPSDMITGGLLPLLRASWRLIVLCAVLVAVVSVLPSLLRHRTYTSQASFIPYSQKGGSMFSGLAERLGVDVGQDKGQSPAFYADLVLAREVLRQTITTAYPLPGQQGRTMTLMDAYGFSRERAGVREEKTMNALREAIIVGANQRTGLITLSVSDRDPRLAQMIGARLIDRVNSLNLQRRQSQGAAERRFTEERLNQLQAELRTADNRYAAFVSGNRGYQSDPELLAQARRLEQDVAFRRQVVTSLSSALEQARIDEVRDTPNITVIDPPDLPALPDSRRILLKLVFGFLTGAIVGAGLGLWRDVRSQERLPSSRSLS